MDHSNKKVYSLIIKCFSVILVAVLIIIAAPNRNRESPVYSITGDGIIKQDPTTNERTTIFNTAGLYKVSFSVSPSSSIIGVLITERGTILPGEHDYSVLPKNYLVIISSDGKEVFRLDEDVRKYSWSPDGESIAYITGTYYEGGVGFRVTGTSILNLKDKSKTQIKKDFPFDTLKETPGVGYEINWAKHDSNIYIKDFDFFGGVYRFNTKTGKSEKVDYQGIYFSPDGKYYLDVSIEDKNRLFESQSNHEITLRVLQRFKNLPSSWETDWKHHMLIVETVIEDSDQNITSTDKPLAMGDKRKVKQRTFKIYDVEKDLIVKEWIE